MGLIKAATSAISSGFGDQFKEFVSCPTVDNNVIIQRGEVSHGDGNKNPSDGVISNGSGIAVPEGMAMMIVENGKIVEFSAEPGTFTWDSSSEPSIFYGSLGTNILESIKTIGQRITFGGQTAKDQRVYYINIKNIMGNTFGSSQPETIFDPVYNSVEITYNGEYAIKVVDPVVLVNNVSEKPNYINVTREMNEILKNKVPYRDIPGSGVNLTAFNYQNSPDISNSITFN